MAGLTEPFVSVQEFFPRGFWLFGLAGEYPCSEQGEQGAGQGSLGVDLWGCSPWGIEIAGIAALKQHCGHAGGGQHGLLAAPEVLCC